MSGRFQELSEAFLLNELEAEGGTQRVRFVRQTARIPGSITKGLACIPRKRHEDFPVNSVRAVRSWQHLVTKQPAPALPILLAEDDENDTFFFRRALERSGLPNQLITVQDGQQAVDYLTGKGAYADRECHPLPGLLLLDLKMPRMDGFEVLAWLNSQPYFEELPVVVLSSSALDSDIQKARDLGADDYQVKPQNSDDLVTIIRELHVRWLS